MTCGQAEWHVCVCVCVKPLESQLSSACELCYFLHRTRLPRSSTTSIDRGGTDTSQQERAPAGGEGPPMAFAIGLTWPKGHNAAQ